MNGVKPEPCLKPEVCVSLRQGDSGMSSEPDAFPVPKSCVAFGHEHFPMPVHARTVPAAKRAAKMLGGAKGRGALRALQLETWM